MLAWLASFLTGPLLSKAVDAYKLKLQAGNDRDKLAAELAAKELQLDVRQAELASQTVIAEQGRWYTAMIRPLFAAPFIVFSWKVIVWDKCLGWGTTDALAGDISTWGGYVVLAYFGGRSVEKVARIFARR